MIYILLEMLLKEIHEHSSGIILLHTDYLKLHCTINYKLIDLLRRTIHALHIAWVIYILYSSKTSAKLPNWLWKYIIWKVKDLTCSITCFPWHNVLRQRGKICLKSKMIKWLIINVSSLNFQNWWNICCFISPSKSISMAL